MTEVRVGDVRRLKNSTTRFLVTDIEYNDDRRFDWIYTSVGGDVRVRLWRKTIEEESIFIKHYNTWQEAVKSEEIK